MKSVHLLFVYCSAAITSLFFSSKVLSAPVTMPVGVFSGNFTSIPIVYNSQSLETGPITLSLDSSRTDHTFNYDDSLSGGLSSIDLYLLLDFPALKVIGGPAPTIHILENGISGVDGDDFTADLTGGGTITDPSSVFDGVSFSNRNRYNFKCVLRPFNCELRGGNGDYKTQGAIVTLPDRLGGGSSPISGGGSISVPEPSFTLLNALEISAVLGTSLVLKRQQKKQKLV